VEVEHVRAFETGLYQFLETRRPQVLTSLAEKRQLDDEMKAALNAALKEFAAQFAASRKAA
jgi:F0F1-type ATP synthase alpha subunit